MENILSTMTNEEIYELHHEQAKKIIEQYIVDNEITMTFKFVPFSLSRNKDNKHKSMNWVISVLKKGEVILNNFDYSEGDLHCPAAKLRDKFAQTRGIELECETGFVAELAAWHLVCRGNSEVPTPQLAQVFGCLLEGCNVLSYDSREKWCQSLGYSSDSIKDKEVYDYCLKTAMKLRNKLADLEKLVLVANQL